MTLAVKMAPSTRYEQMQATCERMHELGFRPAMRNENSFMSDEVYLSDDPSLRIVIKHEPNISILSFEQRDGHDWREIGRMSRAGFASYEALPPAFVSIRPATQDTASAIRSSYDA